MEVPLGKGPGNPWLGEFGRCKEGPGSGIQRLIIGSSKSFLQISEVGGWAPLGESGPWHWPVSYGICLGPLSSIAHLDPLLQPPYDRQDRASSQAIRVTTDLTFRTDAAQKKTPPKAAAYTSASL